MHGIETVPIKGNPAVAIGPINLVFLARAEETVSVASHNGDVSNQSPFFTEKKSQLRGVIG